MAHSRCRLIAQQPQLVTAKADGRRTGWRATLSIRVGDFSGRWPMTLDRRMGMWRTAPIRIPVTGEGVMAVTLAHAEHGQAELAHRQAVVS